MLEDHGHGIRGRQDAGLGRGEEVGGGGACRLVGVDGEGRRDGLGIGIIGGEGGLVGAFLVPFQAAVEGRSIVGHLLVGGIGAGRAGNGQADGVAAFEVGGVDLGDDRLDTQVIVRLDGLLAALVAGRQGEKTEGNND